MCVHACVCVCACVHEICLFVSAHTFVLLCGCVDVRVKLYVWYAVCARMSPDSNQASISKQQHITAKSVNLQLATRKRGTTLHMVGTHPEKSRKGLFQYDRCTLTVSAHPEKSRKGLFQHHMKGAY